MAKKLLWVENEGEPPYAEADTGTYVINEHYRMVERIIGHGRSFQTRLERISLEKGASLEDLKTAAQDDMDARIAQWSGVA